MPYPETCPECAGPFRNTGTHFTARRQELGRHVLLELGCQNSSRRYWWDFTQGKLAGGDGRNPTDRELAASTTAAAAGTASVARASTNGHVVELATPPTAAPAVEQPPTEPEPEAETRPAPAAASAPAARPAPVAHVPAPAPEPVEPPPTASAEPAAGLAQARAAFLRQLELDRLTLRQMRGWLISEEARRAAEVAAGATEATYERLSLALFGGPLPQLLGQSITTQPSTQMTAEERLELQREKARIRARQRRAAIKAARLGGPA
ncbi:MAG: hypothetical protein JO023_16045 [Chloroflexi bacterium]|nr:hypothetical protein [Chloroflexota bacterium]